MPKKEKLVQFICLEGLKKNMVWMEALEVFMNNSLLNLLA
jgi:hypothetical protein